MNKINKIIILFESTFTARDYQRFGVETLEQNGFKVEIWELSRILFRNAYDYDVSNSPVNLKTNFKGYRLFESMKEILNEISKLDKTNLIICSLGYTVNSYFIYRAISKKGITTYAITALSNIPYVDANNDEHLNIANYIKWFINKIKKITLHRLIHSIFISISQRLLGIAPITYSLNSGGRACYLYPKYFPITTKTKDIMIHALDYDLYLREKEIPVSVENDLGVFLDQNLVFHPDYLFMKWAPHITENEYFPRICNFFEMLETNYNIRIVIAAHPSSSYETQGDYFSGRQVIKGKTIELVRKSRFIIAHSSFSTNYAVLFKKPIIFITTNQLNNSHLGRLNHKLAEMLGKKSINLNEQFNIDWEFEMKVNEQKYLEYKNKYIKKQGTEELPFWQVAANHIKQIDIGE